MELLSCEALLIEPSGITIEDELANHITPTCVLLAPISSWKQCFLQSSSLLQNCSQVYFQKHLTQKLYPGKNYNLYINFKNPTMLNYCTNLQEDLSKTEGVGV